MKWPILFSLLVPLSVWSASLPLSEAIFDASKLNYLHPAPGPEVVSYVAMNLKFEPAESLRTALEKHLGLSTPLLHRGEAHITLVTPGEYLILQAAPKGFGYNDIEALLQKSGLQRALFDTVCVGKGYVASSGAEKSTYYVVVKSDELRALRNRLFELYKARGGNPSLFDPAGYYPHITLGFTERDLHESDGVKKGQNSCFLDIEIQDAVK